MFIQEIKIKKSNWHYKLLKFVIGEDNVPKMNFCPYFWLTIFSLFICPFVGIFKTIKYALIKFEKLMDYILFNHLEKIKFQKIVDDEESLYYALIMYHDWNRQRYFEVINKIGYDHYIFKIKGREDLCRIYELFINNFEGDVDEYLNQLEKKREQKNIDLQIYYNKLSEEIRAKEDIETKRKDEIRIKKKVIINTIIKYTKILTPFFVAAIIGLIIFGLFKIIYWLCTSLTFNMTIPFIYAFIVLSFIALIIVVCRFLLKKLSEPRFDKNDNYKTSIVERIVKSINSFFNFFIDFFVAWKNDNCPGIIWDDNEDLKK